MRRHRHVTVVLFASLVVLASLHVVAQGTRRTPSSAALVGTWKLTVHQDRESEDKAWTHMFGEHPKGYIVYDATGHVFVQIMKTPVVKPFASGDDTRPTPDEAKAAYLAYVSYFGTYTVDETKHEVTHHVEGSLWPNLMEAEAHDPRPFELTGDRLVIGDSKTWMRVFERVK